MIYKRHMATGGKKVEIENKMHKWYFVRSFGRIAYYPVKICWKRHLIFFCKVDLGKMGVYDSKRHTGISQHLMFQCVESCDPHKGSPTSRLLVHQRWRCIVSKHQLHRGAAAGAYLLGTRAQDQRSRWPWPFTFSPSGTEAKKGPLWQVWSVELKRAPSAQEKESTCPVLALELVERVPKSMPIEAGHQFQS